jgi:hypothetical protein
MPITPASAHVDSALSNFATAYQNNGFIADKLSPIVNVELRSDKFHTRNRRDVSHVVSDVISPKGEAQLATYDTGLDNYSVTDRALKDVVVDSLIRNADAPLNPKQLAVQSLMQKLSLGRESRVSTQLCNPSNYASGNTAGASVAWSNMVSSTPLSDILTGKAAIPFSGEDSRVVAFCALPVWNILRRHPELLALKGTDKGMISREEFAQFFEIDELHVSEVWKETANIAQTASYSRMWSATVFGILRVPNVLQGADISAFSATFRVDPGIQVRSWETPETGIGGSETIQVEFSDDEKIVQNDMGYLITGVA